GIGSFLAGPSTLRPIQPAMPFTDVATCQASSPRLRWPGATGCPSEASVSSANTREVCSDSARQAARKCRTVVNMPDFTGLTIFRLQNPSRMFENVFETVNSGFAQALYEDFLRDPASVPPEWRALFESGLKGEAPPSGNGAPKAANREPAQ